MFQSHAGSIEARILALLPALRDQGFNPTLVRLRPGQRADRALRAQWFQSHAGSIEAPDPPAQVEADPGFQSHAGSIEAQRDVRAQIFAPRGFNPTLVRLRLRIRNHDLVAVRSFQSHAGSIEAFHIEARVSAWLGVSIPRWFD